MVSCALLVNDSTIEYAKAPAIVGLAGKDGEEGVNKQGKKCDDDEVVPESHRSGQNTSGCGAK